MSTVKSVRVLAAIAAVTAVSWSCEAGNQTGTVAGPLLAVDCDKNPQAGACQGDGGDGTGGGSEIDNDVAIQSGVVAGPQGVQTRDNKKVLDMENPAFSVRLDLSATQTSAQADVDGEAFVGGNCKWKIPAGAEGLVQGLVDAMVDAAASSRNFSYQIGKQAALDEVESTDHFLTVHPEGEDTPRVQIGKNNAGEGNFLIVTYDDGDGNPNNNSSTINDPSATRIFTASDGTVRVLDRFAGGRGGKDSGVWVRCPFLDSFVATVTPPGS